MNYTKLSNGISWVLHPFVLPVYMIVLLLTATTFALYPANVKFYLLWVVVLYAVIIPVLALGVLRSLGRISDFRVDDRRERLLPLLVGTVCYVLCAVTISKTREVRFGRARRFRREAEAGSADFWKNGSPLSQSNCDRGEFRFGERFLGDPVTACVRRNLGRAWRSPPS